MKLTKKTVKHEVETTENVCEITQEEFDQICARVAASTVMQTLGDNPDVEDLAVGMHMTAFLAEFVSNLDDELFNDTNENPDKKEEK